MYEAWTKDANLTWTDQMQDRYSDDEWAKLELRTAESFVFGRDRPLKAVGKGSSLSENLVKAISQNATLSASLGGMTLKEAKATGYWKLTKFVTDQVAERARQANKTLVLTGHSQGGTRAQLASMYLYQKTHIAYPTISFAATGAACVARLLFDTTSNLLDDVNPFVRHENMVEYVHPLDPWGNSMLGIDNGGQVLETDHWRSKRVI